MLYATTIDEELYTALKRRPDLYNVRSTSAISSFTNPKLHEIVQIYRFIECFSIRE